MPSSSFVGIVSLFVEIGIGIILAFVQLDLKLADTARLLGFDAFPAACLAHGKHLKMRRTASSPLSPHGRLGVTGYPPGFLPQSSWRSWPPRPGIPSCSCSRRAPPARPPPLGR